MSWFRWYFLVVCLFSIFFVSCFVSDYYYYFFNDPQGSFAPARDLSKQDNAAVPVSRSIQLLSCFQIHVKLHSIPSKGRLERGKNFAYGQVLGRTNNMLSYHISFAWDFPSRMICYFCVAPRVSRPKGSFVVSNSPRNCNSGKYFRSRNWWPCVHDIFQF